MSVFLNYGKAGTFSCDIASRRIMAMRPGPAACPDVRERLRSVLAAPLEFPALEQLCIPGDKVVLALDRQTPVAPELIAGIWEVLEKRGVDAPSLSILQPVALDAISPGDPRTALPEEIRGQIRWSVHDAVDERRQAYLATTARGQRIYLDGDVVEADVVISVGAIAYDPLLGFRGTSSVLYPGLSTAEDIARARGEGHSELGPHDERPLRQTIDEIAWLLGTQFSVQVIPGQGASACRVLAGGADSVFREGQRLLEELWCVRLAERAELVVVAVDVDCSGHGWNQIGAALATARNLVARGGKVIVLSELEEITGDGLNIIRQGREPRDALRAIRKQAPLDMIPATQVASAADWSRIYLLSRMPPDVVDELFMTPLANEREVQRLLSGDEPCVFVGSAQHTWGEVVAD
jgi:nickel-dependent lactate racemase